MSSDLRASASGRVTAPAVVDHHVHLGLVDWRALGEGPVGEVHDLGWDPAEIDRIARELVPSVRVRSAGPFHTAPGGYPSGRAWAPDAAIVSVDAPESAVTAVAAVSARGGLGVKIALHAGMPLLPDPQLRALIDAAHAAGLRAFVHAEGAGQAARAIDLGADVLVHVPWTERLGDDTIRRAAEAGMEWISTLSIHAGVALERALDNARRFRAAGGTLRYGTDLGNGDLPVGLNAREIRLLGEAGLAGDALHAAVFSRDPRDSAALSHTDPLPTTADALADWLATAIRRSPIDRNPNGASA
ncbi:hydrolase [Leucobacter rhizosphaerae]|uniref:Hydrolase n=1 Tax=Leucobacter rhizosphaerae TaxID=2932245 RepID=A0ABY4FRY4_9MICO|nr:hydrolase [Leucobacter rhizosphaerae]UOQ59050.1 hydrolase [Leucobacter rhizosphaerae]